MISSQSTLLWPYLTADFPPIPGTVKESPGDFLVEEIPAYEACGAGEHLFVRIEKTGLTTRQAVDQIARVLKIRAMGIGLAGLKDTEAASLWPAGFRQCGQLCRAMDRTRGNGLKLAMVFYYGISILPF